VSRPIRSLPVTCGTCGRVFRPRRATRQYCSRSCAVRAQPRALGDGPGRFKTGHGVWNKGITGEASHAFGHTLPDDVRERLRLRVLGEANPVWRNGISPENERQRKTTAYARWRRAVFERDDYRCRSCGVRSTAGARVRVHADHIQSFALHPELRLELANGRTLCEACHKKTETYGFGSHKRRVCGRQTNQAHA
jgi:5-methylcytosine-specific restriction endonuclease McrA